jgi:pimeloyl-ACP methyl ester carboxylesterase
MPFFENRRGLKIYYQDYNPDGNRCVVLLHGWGSSVSFFHQQIPMLEKAGFRVVAFDAEGHGRSEKAKLMTIDDITATTRDNIIRDLEDLGKFIHLPPRMGIIGHSLVGGGIAQLYAIQHPDIVSWLCLLNTGTLIIDNVVRNVFWNALPKFIRIQYATFVKNRDVLTNILEKMLPFIHLAIAGEIEKSSAPPPELDVLIQMEINEMFSSPIPAEKVSVPSIIMGAELDDFAPVELTKELHTKIRNSALKIIPMAGHFAPAHHWEEVNQYIQDFIQKRESAVIGR